MLNIIYDLSPFIEDCYAEFGVREYAKEMKISPPTASKILKKFEAEGFLKKRNERRYLLFRANRESETLKDLSRLYWKTNFKLLWDFLDGEFHSPTIILFGSLTKLEAKKDSDIDVVIITPLKKTPELSKYEKMYKREIQLFKFESIDKINKELKKNITNGKIIRGEF